LEAPPALQQIVRRCLAKDPDRRFPTMADVRQALQHLTPAGADVTTSIAVLPFANLSRDADDEYFSDGLSEEIINALTQVRGLKVIARTSAFAFKGKNEDIRRIANTLGVTYLLEGSVRRADNRLKISVQLVSAYAQGAIYATNAIDLGTTSQFDGPLDGQTVMLGQSTSSYFPGFSFVPAGMPGNPEVYAQPQPPQLYAG